MFTTTNACFKQTGITVLEALAASGLRSLRYALEVPNIKKILANDFSKAAVEAMNKNIKENQVDDIVEAQNHDAVLSTTFIYSVNLRYRQPY